LSKRYLMRALVSLSDAASVEKRELLTVDLPESNLSGMLFQLRMSVWRRLCEFAEDVQVPLQSRIFSLEILESIRSGKVLRQDLWRPVLHEDDNIRFNWGKWEAEGGSLDSVIHRDEAGEERGNVGNSVNVLLALKSTHIINGHWPDMEVTSSDLSSAEAAITFFNRLLDGTSSLGHAKSLKALLEQWDTIYGSGHWQGEESRVSTPRTPRAEEKEDWGEGWEEFGENSFTVHVLHTCWKVTIQKLTELGGLREALSSLDAALLHPTGVLLLEDEVRELVASTSVSNPSAALQLSLLLPYSSCQIQGLEVLEEKLASAHDKSSGLADPSIGVAVNQELMALVLSSGLLTSVADKPSFNAVFSGLCEFLGQLALQAQELQLSMKPSLNECLVSADNVPFCAVAFPFFVAELTKLKKFGQAGALVLQVMRVHPALATWNAAYIALQRYLSTQADGASVDSVTRRGSHFLRNEDVLQAGHLKNTVHSLTCRLEEVLKSALKTLSKDMN
jgi:hypothetical protein